jgi:hypothetical protein
VAIVPCAPEGIAAVRARHEASGTRYVEVCVAGRDSPEDSTAAVHSLLVGHSRPAPMRGTPLSRPVPNDVMAASWSLVARLDWLTLPSSR